MKIKFTITLSDDTVDAFKVTGSRDAETVKNCMVSELRAFFVRVKDDAQEIIDQDANQDDDADEDDDDEDEEFDEAPPVVKTPPRAKKKVVKKKR